MRYAFYLEGQAYSQNKEAFKDLLKKHGLRWKGSFDEPWWGSEREKVEASFQRDQARDVTLSATLVWRGRGATPLLAQLQAWTLSVGGRVEAEEKAPTVHRPATAHELEFWDILNKPDEKYMRAEGRPRRWIELDMKDWRRRRKEKERELQGS